MKLRELKKLIRTEINSLLRDEEAENFLADEQPDLPPENNQWWYARDFDPKSDRSFFTCPKCKIKGIPDTKLTSHHREKHAQDKNYAGIFHEAKRPDLSTENLASKSIEELKLLYLRLFGKALKAPPSSPRQLEIRKEHEKVGAELKRRGFSWKNEKKPVKEWKTHDERAESGRKEIGKNLKQQVRKNNPKMDRFEDERMRKMDDTPKGWNFGTTY